MVPPIAGDVARVTVPRIACNSIRLAYCEAPCSRYGLFIHLLCISRGCERKTVIRNYKATYHTPREIANEAAGNNYGWRNHGRGRRKSGGKSRGKVESAENRNRRRFDSEKGAAGRGQFYRKRAAEENAAVTLIARSPFCSPKFQPTETIGTREGSQTHFGWPGAFSISRTINTSLSESPSRGAPISPVPSRSPFLSASTVFLSARETPRGSTMFLLSLSLFLFGLFRSDRSVRRWRPSYRRGCCVHLSFYPAGFTDTSQEQMNASHFDGFMNTLGEGWTGGARCFRRDPPLTSLLPDASPAGTESP